MKKAIFLYSLVATSAALFLQGCGGSGASTATTTPSASVSGVAAVGAPISSGAISLIGANGATAAGSISEAGSYTVDTTGLTFPILVRVDGVAGGESTVHYTVINQAGGSINANPVTTAIVTLAMRQDPGDVFQNVRVSDIALLTPTAVANASSTLNTALNAARTAAGLATTEDVNFLSGSFVANKTGLDKILDLIKLQVDADESVIISNKTDDAVMRVALPTTAGAVPTSSGSLGTVQSINTSAIDTLGSSFSAQFSNVATNFAAGGNSAVQALFDADFLHGGMGAAATIAFLANSPEMNGASFLPSKVRNCTGTGTAQDNYVCDAVFTIKYSDNGLESFGFPVKRQADNTWKFFGDQAIADTSINPVTWRTVNGNSPVVDKAGVNVSVRKNTQGQFVTSSGSQINKTEVYLGGAVSGAPVATLVTPQANSCSNSTNYMVLSTGGCGNFIEMADANIDSLRSQARPKVTLRFLDAGNGQIGTFTTYLEATPFKPSEVTADRFATFTDASWNAYNQASANAVVSIVLDKSASVALEDLVGGIYPTSGSVGDSLAFDTVRRNTTFSVKRGNDRNDLIAVTKDSAGRVFWFQRSP